MVKMFNATDKPRVFGLPPGSDFPKDLVQGLFSRTQHLPPQDLARVEILVNTRRMQRRLTTVFDEGSACLLPKIRLITNLSSADDFGLPTPIPALQRKLELSQLIAQLLRQQPDLAPKAALFDLSESLSKLMDEMQGEAVPPEVIEALDVSDESGHWERALTFVNIARRYFGPESEPPDGEAWQRLFVKRLIESWANSPPQHPIIVAGSTGSRGTTSLLMEAVAKLPQGALLLPGFDFLMPNAVWTHLDTALTGEDHPQFRFSRLLNKLDVTPDSVPCWNPETETKSPRNSLISLSLRPAPVTDHWLREGPNLPDLPGALSNMTLIEAPDQRAEAGAIALRLREAVEMGQQAALITPDRVLARRVSAALDVWGIIPDDSAGMPLPLSAPGRLLLHVAHSAEQQVTAESLLTILKHPLVSTGANDRGHHLLWTRELELKLRRSGPPFPTPEDLKVWADGKHDRKAWVDWIANTLFQATPPQEVTLLERLNHHIVVTENLCAGPGQEGSGALWEDVAGREAGRILDEFRQSAVHGGAPDARDYLSLFKGVLNQGEVREFDAPHPLVLIWGTLEARVQGADLVILGGLNEGSWPETPPPDPWLNRSLRAKAGLLLPERRIGLAAHDFQQAVGAHEVLLTRSVRSEDAETVPSRWINRLSNLVYGLDTQNDTAYMADLRGRGQRYLDTFAKLNEVEPKNPASRPSPQPPAGSRPKKLSVTEIKTLIRDPFAIYAKHILRVRPLDTLVKAADAPLRGVVLHDVMERFIERSVNAPAASTKEALMLIASEVLENDAPWPAARRLWYARLKRVADAFLEQEAKRRESAVPVELEAFGDISIPELGFQLVGKADRIDKDASGSIRVYDYKTGAPPTASQQLYFDKQLLLEAAMIERGAFEKLGPQTVVSAEYLGLADPPRAVSAPLGESDVWAEFQSLIKQYMDEDQGYTARRALPLDSDFGRYDQLARFGEWDTSAEPKKTKLT